MLFNSYSFIFLMLPVSIIGYYLINRLNQRLGMIWIIICSLLFIGHTNIMYLLVLIPCMLFNYSIASFMQRATRRRALLTLGVSVNVIVLLIFKYTNFFIDYLNENVFADSLTFRIFFPLGISFYTFQQITFLVDYYRDDSLHCDIIEYFAYISFYPQFVQGPIVLQSEMIPQFRDASRKTCDYRYLSKGLYRFALGLIKKVLLANIIASAVDAGYRYISELGALATTLLLIGYSLQIYFDFSGYSDMAIGVGWMFHLDLPENFDSPYKAKSIEDFWDRWHITLTRFFTRYVYFPLGGSKKGSIRTYINILIIFILSGLWHGSDSSFVIWGLMHGAGMLVCRIYRDVRKALNINKFDLKKSNLVNCIGTVITFIYVSIAWVLFRADSISKAGRVFKRFRDWGDHSISSYMYEPFNKFIEATVLLRLDVLDINEHIPGFLTGIVIVMLMVVCMILPNSRQIVDGWSEKLGTRNMVQRFVSSIAVATMLIWGILSLSGVTDFVYWSF